MASNNLGTLTLDLIAKTGGWVSGMTEAERATDKFAKKAKQRKKEVEAEFSKWKLAGAATLTAGLAAGIGIFKAWIDETKNAENEQAQLAAVLRSTGNSAGFSQERLNLLAESLAKVSTFASGDITSGMTRLLSYGGVQGAEFARASQAALDMAQRLGMELPQAFELVGKAIDKPSQGMTALSKQGFKFTEEQKELAKQLEATGQTAKAQAMVLDEMDFAYKGAAAAAKDTLGGALADLQNAFKDTISGSGGGSANDLKKAIQDLATLMRSDDVKNGFTAIITGLTKVAQAAIEAIGFMQRFGTALGETIARGIHGSDDPAQRLRDQAADLEKEAERLNSNKLVPLLGRAFGNGDKKALDALKQAAALRQQAFEFERDIKGGAPAPAVNPAAPDMPVKPIGATGASAADAGKAAAEANAIRKAQLKAVLDDIKRGTQAMLSALDDRQSRLDMQQEQGLLSIAAYYKEKASIEQEALAEKLKGIDAEIAAQQSAVSGAAKETERIAANSKLNDLIAERAELTRKSALEIDRLNLAQDNAMRELTRKAEDVKARFLEMTGQLAEAARLRANLDNMKDIAELERNGEAEAANQLRQIKAMQEEQGRLNQLKREYGLITDELAIYEERINLAAQTGRIGEIEQLGQTGLARQAAIEQLQKMLEVYMQINAVASTPETALAVERLKLQLEQLQAVAEPLAQKFQAIFEDSFGNAFTDLLTGAKNAKDAFTDMANSIVQQISRMAAQQIASGLFGGGKGGGLGGFGKFLSGIFGFATGSSYIAHDQVALLHQGERVLTAQENRQFTGSAGQMVVNNNFTVSGETSRQTQLQIASAAAGGLSRAQRRNG